MGIGITLYMQQAIASIFSELGSENFNVQVDRATQTVRDVLFVMSKKVLAQLGRTGAYDHFICRKATMVDKGLWMWMWLSMLTIYP